MLKLYRFLLIGFFSFGLLFVGFNLLNNCLLIYKQNINWYLLAWIFFHESSFQDFLPMNWKSHFHNCLYLNLPGNENGMIAFHLAAQKKVFLRNICYKPTTREVEFFGFSQNPIRIYWELFDVYVFIPTYY